MHSTSTLPPVSAPPAAAGTHSVWKTSIRFTIVTTILLGLGYPLLVTGIAGVFPVLGALNIMYLHSPQSAILSAVIFNAVIIVALIPLALKGVKYEPKAADILLRNNLLIYGVGGIIVPFIGIKAIDMLLVAVHLA